MSDLVFMDTETTGLLADDDVWEFAAIRRLVAGGSISDQFFIEHDRVKCARLPDGFREQHYDRYRDHRAIPPQQAAHRIHRLFGTDDPLDKPHVVGCVPDFDTLRIARLLGKHGFAVPWHYHLIDVENIAVGFLSGYEQQVIAPPWNSEDLSRAVGVDPELFERHTAMGDVLWAQAIFDSCMGQRP